MDAEREFESKSRRRAGALRPQFSISWLLVVATAISSLVYGQVITGRIFGTVRDTSGAVVPNATVIVTNQTAGVQYKYTSNGAGLYSVPDLPVGEYIVSVSSHGFKTTSVPGITVSVASSVRVDVQLEVGSSTTSVQVSGVATQLSTTTAAVSDSITQRLIENLPVEGRDLLNLALLTPGVSPRGTCPVSCVSGNSYLGTDIPTVDGARGESVSFTVGGLNINNRTFETPMEKPPLDSLSDFTVLADDYSAQYGLGDGQVIADTRSGTDTFHGSAYEYLENTVFDSRYFLAPTTDILHYNQFGASVGGPVLLPGYNGRNRTFFFFNYEGTRSPSANTQGALFPTSSMLNGDFSALKNEDGTPDIIYDPQTTNLTTGTRQPFPGNIVPSNRISPVSKTLLAAYKTPLTTSSALPYNFYGPVADNTTVDQYVARVDVDAGSKNSFSTRYNFSNPYLFTGALESNATNTLALRNQLVGQTWTHIFSPTAVNSFRFGYTRQLNVNVPPVAASEDLQQEAGYAHPTPYNMLPEILLNSASGSPSFTEIPSIVAGGSGQIQEQFQWVDDMSWINGKHSMKFGADIRRQRWDTTGEVPAGASGMQFTGVFTSQLAYDPSSPTAGPGGYTTIGETGSPIADLDLGQVQQEAYGLGTATFAFRDSQFSWYAEDSYRLTRRFTINYGLRWDYEGPVGEKYGKESWFVANSPPCPEAGGCLLTDGVYKGLPYDPIVNPFPGDDKIANGGGNPQYHNFAPRLSIAYLLGKRTVFRAGGGIFYSIWEQYQIPDAVTQAPFGTGYQILNTGTITTSSQYQLNAAWAPLSKTAQGYVAPGTVSLNPTYLTWDVTPRVNDFSASIQHQFSSNTTLEIGYSGKFGNHLADFEQANTCTTPPGQPCQYNAAGQPLTIYPNFGDIYAMITTGTSNYEAAYVHFVHNFSHGLSFGANYTFSDMFSTGFDSDTDDIFQGGNDILSLDDPRLKNYHRSVMDVPNDFVAYGLYQLPFGRGHALGASASRPINAIIGGWQASWVTSFDSGMTGDLSSFGAGYFVSADASKELKRLDFRKTGYFFDPSLFTSSPTPWPVPPDSFRDAGVNNWDISLSKAFSITERHSLALRADFFNAFNHAQFEEPESRVFESGFGKFLLNMPSDEGVSLRPPRIIELSLRYSF